MSDHYGGFDAEAALDALLAGHQAGLRSAVASALDTRAGLAQASRLQAISSRDLGAAANIRLAPTIGSRFGIVAKGESSALDRVLDAVDDEVRELDALITELQVWSMRRTTPPGARTGPVASLIVVQKEMSRIKDLLLYDRITKGSVGTEFQLAETLLKEQAAGWAEKAERVPRAQRHAAMRTRFTNVQDQFTARYDATTLLRTLIVRLFEDVEETVLQLS
ncbi:hypothetical protein [Streptomyces lavendulae]|uniref:hypothetical protein n=1 Tax=Streptomyces lavendulae TaxID=1914 RepID=UPI00381FCA80